MKFGVREIADVVFKAKSDVKIGNALFKKGQPVLYIDTAKTSTIEGAATSVYAQGGKGNPRLITWEGEKTLTFTVEDALLSPMGFAILSGAGLFKGTSELKKVHVHATTTTTIGSDGKISLKDALAESETICGEAPIFVVETEADGSVTGTMIENLVLEEDGVTLKGADTSKAGTTVFVDYYVIKDAAQVSELSIDAANFAGSYYVEASTLFRRQDTGVDMPAEITFPNVKIQSNFTFSMASTGDPSTFTFTMDAMPGYTYFNKENKVLCVIQIVEDASASESKQIPYMTHADNESLDAYDESEKIALNKADKKYDDSYKKPAATSI